MSKGKRFHIGVRSYDNTMSTKEVHLDIYSHGMTGLNPRANTEFVPHGCVLKRPHESGYGEGKQSFISTEALKNALDSHAYIRPNPFVLIDASVAFTGSPNAMSTKVSSIDTCLVMFYDSRRLKDTHFVLDYPVAATNAADAADYFPVFLRD